MARGAIDVPARLLDYVVAMGVRETPVQRRLREVTRRIPHGGMQIGPEQAALMQVPTGDKKKFETFLEGLGYPYRDESRNPAYRLFLG